MQKTKSKTKNEILTKLNELEALLRKKNDKPLNFNQAADYLGFSHSYLYKLTSRKIIPCHRPTGKMLFFSKEELDEWIFENRSQKTEISSQNEDASTPSATADRLSTSEEDDEPP